MPDRGFTTSALLTDFYELTMMQGYFLKQYNPHTVFELFFRRAPFGGGFTVFAGLEPLLEAIAALRFSPDDLAYLEAQGTFHREFLDYLASFRFTGAVYAMEEGAIAFPNEPLLRVHAPLIEAQLIESLALNIINFQTLVATKAARIWLASEEGTVLEFGLRRAHGVNGALAASRAAYIGGASATSNTLAGKLFDIPVKGTMAHSWIMAFESELSAFQKYAEVYPDGCILLIDTYDTLKSGLEHAVEVGKRLKAGGHGGFGVRLDSGDLEYLAKKVRQRLDAEGLSDALIAASNELDEEIIHQLITQGAPIDIWGVGTHLVTGKGDAALTGVYKLAAKEVGGRILPAIKVSNNPDKISDPGIKQVHRFYNGSGSPVGDLLTLDQEQLAPGKVHRFFHPRYPYSYTDVSEYERIESLLTPKMIEGRIVTEFSPLRRLQERARANLRALDATFRRILNPHVYKVSLSQELSDLKFRLIDEYERGLANP
jgi:nicotinate phosphoribosyltransferase